MYGNFSLAPTVCMLLFNADNALDVCRHTAILYDQVLYTTPNNSTYIYASSFCVLVR